jgi:rSAM/selenodomain-associated transferase 1
MHGLIEAGAKDGAGPGGASLATCGIAVMAKASVDGRTKTRLVPPLTYREAAAFNTAFLKDIADNVGAAARHASIAGYMAFGPPGSEQFFRDHLPPDIALIGAWFPAFGDCLYRAIAEVLARGHGSAVVLNSDSPTLPTSLLVETAQVLAQPGDRAVLGPAVDGGYYLLGLKQAHARMFEGIAWSTSRVAEQTVTRAREIGLDVHMVPPWYDVDDIDALRMLHAHLDGTRAAPCQGGFETRPCQAGLSPYRAAHTVELMSSLLRTSDLARRLAELPALEGAVL